MKDLEFRELKHGLEAIKKMLIEQGILSEDGFKRERDAVWQAYWDARNKFREEWWRKIQVGDTVKDYSDEGIVISVGQKPWSTIVIKNKKDKIQVLHPSEELRVLHAFGGNWVSCGEK